MKKAHEVKNVRFKGKVLLMMVDGIARKIDVNGISERLANASEKELCSFEVSPSGYGIHWPLIDEDLSIDALLGIKHKPRTGAPHIA